MANFAGKITEFGFYCKVSGKFLKVSFILSLIFFFFLEGSDMI